jgi:hypothetical protein
MPRDGDAMNQSGPKKRSSSSLEGKRIRCLRCWAEGTFVRRTGPHDAIPSYRHNLVLWIEMGASTEGCA